MMSRGSVICKRDGDFGGDFFDKSPSNISNMISNRDSRDLFVLFCG